MDPRLFPPQQDRKEGIFEVKALHLEPGVVVRYATKPGLAERLSD